MSASYFPLSNELTRETIEFNSLASQWTVPKALALLWAMSTADSHTKKMLRTKHWSRRGSYTSWLWFFGYVYKTVYPCRILTPRQDTINEHRSWPLKHVLNSDTLITFLFILLLMNPLKRVETTIFIQYMDVTRRYMLCIQFSIWFTQGFY